MIRAAVVGVGHMGAAHAFWYEKLDGVRLMAVIDSDKSVARRVSSELQCRAFSSLSRMDEEGVRVDVVSIAVPTAFHYEYAAEFLSRGIHCLVEKPMASTVGEAEKLVELAAKNSVTLLPGHIERFNPAVLAVRSERPRLRYIKSYRVGPMSFRSIDIDVVRDVMIHDIDLACFLAGSNDVSVEAAFTIASPEELNDVANVHLSLAGECHVDLTASRLAIARRRKMRMNTVDTYFSIDCGARRAMRLRRDSYLSGLKRLRVLQEMGRKISPEEIFNASGAVSIAEPGGSSDPLESEIVYFLRSAEGRRQEKILCAEDGAAAIRICEEIEGVVRRGGALPMGGSFRGGNA